LKKLNTILYGVSLEAVSGPTDVSVAGLDFDSRKIDKNFVFIAIRGALADGHDYIQQAVAKGATAIICEALPIDLNDTVTYVQVKDAGQALGIIASNYFDNPSKQLILIGITGTNGKTTVATMLYQLFAKLGYRSGLLSTISNRVGDKEIKATHTTPDAIQLNSLLQDMVKSGCTHCFMEVSSHALVQGRVAGLQFSGAVFTNISHDHLDYHQAFKEYIKAKKVLFDMLPSGAFSLVNTDDKRGRVMQQNTKSQKSSYSLKSASEFKAKILGNSLEGLHLNIDGKEVWFKVFGDFNAYNLLSIYGTAMLLGEDPDEVLTAMSELDSAPGRLEQVNTPAKITALVDYAHTPDALKNVLETINNFRSGNESVITVVGCGGDRDREKRPVMASIACQLSDKVILTSDNPRNEAASDIIKEMLTGVGPSDMRKTLTLENREEAIKTACMLADDNDIILVAGKGHEPYQEIAGVRYPFDDREVLSRMLKLLKN
jgi:UDP-N-acetylmuramoyl-L-alanyl-D-glutamate--2,6-diaminopimelate ligase